MGERRKSGYFGDAMTPGTLIKFSELYSFKLGNRLQVVSSTYTRRTDDGISIEMDNSYIVIAVTDTNKFTSYLYVLGHNGIGWAHLTDPHVIAVP